MVPPASFAPRCAAAITSSEPARDDDAAPLGEEPSDLFRRRLVLAAAPYDRHLPCHACDPRDGGASRGTGRHARRRRRLRRRLRRAAAREARRDDRQPRQLHALHAAPARGGGGHARAAARRRAAADDVHARGASARPASSRATRERKSVVAETLGGTFEIGYERLVVALGAVPRTFPVPGLAEHGQGLQGRRRRDRAPQPAPPRARVRRGTPRPGRGGARPRLRLRRRGLRRRRGAGGAARPRPGRDSPVVPDAPRDGAALGARRRRSADPPGDPAQARGVHAPRAGAPRDRDPRRDDPRVVRRPRGASSRTGRVSRRGRSSGPPACARTRRSRP